jgi:hypothetical protein
VRRTLPIALLAVALLSACGSVPPPPSLAPSPSLAPPPSLAPSPSPAFSPTAAPSQDATDIGGDQPSAPPLEYDWSRFPRLPLPVLATGRDQIEASAVAGCITRFYQPANDLLGRSAQSDPDCLTGPLPRTAPLVVPGGAGLTVRAPDGYTLGAEIVDGTEAYANVSASSAFPARIDGMTPFGGDSLARAAGFTIPEIQFVAPTEPGDYLIYVSAQLSRIDRTYRELDTVFLYRLRVTAG